MSLLRRIAAAGYILTHGVPQGPVGRMIEPPRLVDSEEGFAKRSEAALRMMDEDCTGFLLLTLHQQDSPIGDIRICAAMDPMAWPAVAMTLEQVVMEVRRR